MLTKGARITGGHREVLTTEYANRYAAGESIRSIAADEGRSYGFVHALLKSAGVDLRSRGGATRGTRAAPQGGSG
ncbi:MAG: transcriptional regulator [Friedmanniella sp.]|nr:transcriptional regulator [Friedmanniella sp.]